MPEEIRTSQTTEQAKPSHQDRPGQPKPTKSCSELTAEANERVERRAKHFVVKSALSANGACAGEGCDPLETEVRPCFELRWGDGPKDKIETDDFEVLHIVASNPYTNVLFKNVTVLISNLYFAEGEPIPNLPDGTPSVDITPTEFISFGDLPPANQSRRCIPREIVLMSRGAKPGDYSLSIKYCYSIELFQPMTDMFKFELIAS